MSSPSSLPQRAGVLRSHAPLCELGVKVPGPGGAGGEAAGKLEVRRVERGALAEDVALLSSCWKNANAALACGCAAGSAMRFYRLTAGRTAD